VLDCCAGRYSALLLEPELRLLVPAPECDHDSPAADACSATEFHLFGVALFHDKDPGSGFWFDDKLDDRRLSGHFSDCRVRLGQFKTSRDSGKRGLHDVLCWAYLHTLFFRTRARTQTTSQSSFSSLGLV
jgi:hypothetical protein